MQDFKVLQTNGSGVLSFATPSGYSNSDALTLFNASGSAPVFACRAFVNFNGTGTPAIREDGNVSSITDNGTGDYTVNFTTAMSDANYAVGSSIQTPDGTLTNFYTGNGVSAGSITTFNQTASAIRVLAFGNIARDCAFLNIAIFR